MTSLTLSFNDIKFNPVQRFDGQIWLSSSELAQALNYKNVKSVSNLYNTNKDEFSKSMTQVIETVTSGNYKKKTRLFSLRGCHLIAMFARTDVAKTFRKWVLDILDKAFDQPISNTPKSKHEPRIHEKKYRDTEPYIHNVLNDQNVQYLMWYVPMLAKFIKNEVYPALIGIKSNYAGHLSDLTLETVVHANLLNRKAIGYGLTLNHIGNKQPHSIEWYLQA